MTPDLDALDALAEKATPGPWRTTQGGFVTNVVDDNAAKLGYFMWLWDATFAAALDPTTVRSLIALARLGAAGLDVERLVRAMRWAGVRAEPDFATIEEAARQVASDYASPMLAAALRTPEPVKP